MSFLALPRIPVRKGNIVKNEEYECGLPEFTKAREFISIDFYVPALMFIIFELEIVILMPMLVNFFFFNHSQLVLVYIWLVVVSLGFIIE